MRQSLRSKGRRMRRPYLLRHMRRPTLMLAAMLAASPAAAHFEVPGADNNGQCVGDADSNAVVAINELITAVNNALGGCPRLPITLNFRGVVGHEPFACGTVFHDVGSGESQFLASDFRFYISNVRLMSGGQEVPLELEQDGVWQYQNVALLDFETGPDDGCIEGNTATNTTVRGTVPAGVYNGVRFDLGVPFDLNHGDVNVAPSPLNFSAMFWTWNSGYKFLRIDTGDDTFRFHLGSTGCNGPSPSRPPTSCSRLNLATITLTGFNPTHNLIEADIGSLLANSNIEMNQTGTVPGCQSDADDLDCTPVFNNLGLNFPEGTVGSTPQTFIRLATEHSEPEHVEIVVASDADGGGALVAHPEFDTSEALPIHFSECLGGTGEDCSGGTRVFTTANPGFNPLEEAEPEESLYPVTDGTPVSVEVTALADGLTFRLGETALDQVGATALLGNAPEFHADLEAQLLLPGGGEPSGTYSATFKLTTTSSQYQSSNTVTVTFEPEGGHEEE